MLFSGAAELDLAARRETATKAATTAASRTSDAAKSIQRVLVTPCLCARSFAGNRALPAKLRAQRQGVTRTRWILLAASLVLLAAVVAAFVAVSRRAARSSSAAPEKSIAVLPFENRSQDKDDSYFADGIQDEILTRLSKIADLKVISRT